MSHSMLLILSHPFSQCPKEGCIRRNVWRCFVNFSSPAGRSTAFNGSYRYGPAPSGEGTLAADRGHMQRSANPKVLQMKRAATNNQRWHLLTRLVLPIVLSSGI